MSSVKRFAFRSGAGTRHYEVAGAGEGGHHAGERSGWSVLLPRPERELHEDQCHGPDLEGAEILLCRHELVFVYNPAETITTDNASIRARRRRDDRPSWLGWPERQRAMGAVTVVVIYERRTRPLKVLVVQSQQPVEAF